jgi:hypothetical protein
MKIRLTETQIKMLIENVGDPMQSVGSDQDTSATIERINKVKAAAQDLKKTLGVSDVSENDIEYKEPVVRSELRDHIDDLLYSLHGFTFFKDRSKPEVSFDDPMAPSLFPDKRSAEYVSYYPKLSPEEQDSIDKKLGNYMSMLKSNNEDELNKVFIALIREKTKPMREVDEPESYDKIDDPEDDSMSVNDYVNSLLQSHPNGLNIKTALDDINSFKPLPAAKLYRVLGELIQKGKLRFDNGKIVNVKDLDAIMNSSSYLSRSNMKKRHNVAFRTMSAPGLNEGKMDFMIGKPIELKKILHTTGKYNPATNAMDSIKRESIVKGVISQFTEEKISRMVVDYKTEQGSSNKLSIMYNKGKNEFVDADTSYHISIEGLTPKDQRTLELFKTNFYDEVINENNFVNSEVFRIIAEAERPRITKKDFINYLKTKK